MGDVANIIAIFQKYDENGDGAISRNEMKAILMAACGFSAADFDDMWTMCDANSDDVVSYEEFANWIFGSGAPPKAREVGADRMPGGPLHLKAEEDLSLSSFTTSYMSLNLWAWSRSRWNSSTQAPLRVAGVPSAQCTTVPSADEEEAAAVTPEVSQRALARVTDATVRRLQERAEAKQKPFDGEALRSSISAWIASMEIAWTQIQGLVAIDSQPTNAKGEGIGVLFAKQDGKAQNGKFPPIAYNGNKVDRPVGAIRPLKNISTISVHLGTEGCGAGLASWQRMLLEHGLGNDGKANKGQALYGALKVNFNEASSGTYRPRCVFASLNDDDLGPLLESQAFDSADLLKGDFNAVTERIRKQAEACDCVGGFMSTYSLCDSLATTSLAQQVWQTLSTDFGKTSKWALCETPGVDGGEEKRSANLMKCIVHLSTLLELADVVNFYDRPSLLNLAGASSNGLGLSAPSPKDCHSIVGRVVSAWTSPIRFGHCGGESRVLNPRSLTTNLLPYPRIKFCVPSVGGLVPEGTKDLVATPGKSIGEAFLGGRLSSVNLDSGTYISAVIVARGLVMSQLLEEVRKCSSSVTSCDHIPAYRALSFHSDSSPNAEQVVCFHHHSSIMSLFDSWTGVVDSADKDLALNELVEGGVDESRFSSAMEDLAALRKDYEEVCTATEVCPEECENMG